MLTLLNWPPSRGPMPAWMKAKPVYSIPPFAIEEIDVVRGNGRRGRSPATEIVRFPTPPAPKSKHAKRRGVIYADDARAALNAEREISLHLSVDVEAVATLRPSQFHLVTGAWSAPPFTLETVVGQKRRVPERPSARGYLPARALTFDLAYPLSKIARVTVRPYSVKRGRGRAREQMDVGYVLWTLAQAYKEIYRRHAKWGVWGHAIGDLVFERLDISDNIGTVSVGS